MNNHAPTHPLRLATGSHRAGSGKGCAMNLISWENGDTTITDMPVCADPMLSQIVQRVNDAVCSHRDGDLLCPSCSMLVLDLAHRTVGTSGHGLPFVELCRVWVQVAVDRARQVPHPRFEFLAAAAWHLADKWAASPITPEAPFAYYGAYEIHDLLRLPDYTDIHPERRLELAHRAIDTFNTLTGLIEAPAPQPETIAEAAARMLAGAR